LRGSCTADTAVRLQQNTYNCVSPIFVRSDMASPTVVTDETFYQEVLKSDTPTLVDFWAVWCGPCRMVAPVVDEIAREQAGKLKVMKLDVDENQGTAMAYGVMSIPTLILFKNGQPVERIVGFRPKSDMDKKILPHLA
jgi:thioredoxin 1